MTRIIVERVSGRGGMRRFIEIAPPLYRDVPAWVRPLNTQLRSRLDPKQEPFWQHAEGQLLVATEQGKDAARLLVMHDRLRQERTNENTGAFGLFEAPHRPDMSRALFDEAARWARDRGLDSLVGPLFLSVHEEVGLLVDGFETPPRVMMPYGREYYPSLFAEAGLTSVREFYSYEWGIQRDAIPAPRRTRRDLVIRRFNPRNRSEEVRRFLQVYNDAFADNWGFVPMTRAEADSAVGDFLRYADLALPLLAEVDGEPAGFILVLPDFNEAVARCKGELWPFGLVRLLWHKRFIRTLRVATLAVRRPFRPLGIAHRLICETWKAGASKGYLNAEFGYIDRDNIPMRKIVERIGAQKAKTYRLYRRTV